MRNFQKTRVACLLSFLAGSSWLAIACDSNVGDGATDDGTTLPPPSSADQMGGSKAGSQNQAGATSSVAGAPGVSGSPGSNATAGTAGSITSGGSSGSLNGGGSTVAAGGTGGGVGGSGTGGFGGEDMPAQCGNGIIETGEECDDKTLSPLCSTACAYLAAPDCVSCEKSYSCNQFTNNCAGSAPPFTFDQQNQCVAVMQCVNSSNCFDGTGSLDGTCYCGSLSLTACRAAPFDLTMAGAPNGACAATIQAGFSGLTTNGDVLDNISNNKQPAGAALQRLTCEKVGDSGSCVKSCGF
jgi:hypothetical protein